MKEVQHKYEFGSKLLGNGSALPKEYQIVWITYIGISNIGTPTNPRYVEHFITRKAFYGKSDGYYDFDDKFIPTPNGYFSVPIHWQNGLPYTFKQYPRVLPEEVIKWKIAGNKVIQ